jgi:hypothetical protein
MLPKQVYDTFATVFKNQNEDENNIDNKKFIEENKIRFNLQHGKGKRKKHKSKKKKKG